VARKAGKQWQTEEIHITTFFLGVPNLEILRVL